MPNGQREGRVMLLVKDGHAAFYEAVTP